MFENLDAFGIAAMVLAVGTLIMSGTVHEFCHAWSAFKLGDPTAKNEGRLSLNPIVHLDPFMSVLLPAIMYFTFGIAYGGMKPVPINPFNLTSRGDMLVSLAGPASNFGLAACALALMVVLKPLVPVESLGFLFLIQAAFINAFLGVFNLLPIPPLDGSHVISYLIPALREPFHRIGSGGMLFIMILLFSGGIGFIFRPIATVVITLVSMIYS